MSGGWAAFWIAWALVVGFACGAGHTIESFQRDALTGVYVARGSAYRVTPYVP